MAFTGAVIAGANRFLPSLGPVNALWINVLFGGVSGALLALALVIIWRRIAAVFEDDRIQVRMANSLLVGFAGAVVGIIVVAAISIALPPSSGARVAQGVCLVACCLLGLRTGFHVRSPVLRSATCAPDATSAFCEARRKILDTSIIIDGRIGDLVSTGFVEGELLVPEFVLSELQNIADSQNRIRRRKGRRGLDVLNRLMQDESVAVRVTGADYPNIREVDRKLIHLAMDEQAVLITTDYNLNRVAQVEGVSVLNVNELSNAVKPRFLPGEDIAVEIVDRGEEINQGVGYLDDGTMVVVENGRRHVGRTIKAVVKSTLQTDAGRMLFAQPASERARWER